MSAAGNIHATAIVLANRGFLFIGPSGSGKSTAALACVSGALQQGYYAAVVADDQVFISVRENDVIAHAPPVISGKCEIRGSDIVKVPAISTCPIHAVIKCIDVRTEPRLAPEGECYIFEGKIERPLIRLSNTTPDIWATVKYLAEFHGVLSLA